MSLSRVPMAISPLESILQGPRQYHRLPTWPQVWSTFFWRSESESTLSKVFSRLLRVFVALVSTFSSVRWDSLKTHAGTFEKALPIRNWLGVSASSSSTSLLTCVKGLALTRLSVSVTIVEKVSQVNFDDPKFKRRARFTICTSLSHIPPKWGAEGWFRRHSTDWLSSFCLMNSWSSLSGCRRMFSGSTKVAAVVTEE